MNKINKLIKYIINNNNESNHRLFLITNFLIIIPLF